MGADMIRTDLTGLAIRWSENPEVSREEVVATAVNAVWIGLERVRGGTDLDRIALVWRPAAAGWPAAERRS